MIEPARPRSLWPQVAIVDYGMGNLFSVANACTIANLDGFVTSDADAIRGAHAVILPGVGAFGDAMDALAKLALIEPIREVAKEGKPLLGICLGLQLFMSRSNEFGDHQGLNLIAGDVVRFIHPVDRAGKRLKVPQVGWNGIFRPEHGIRERWHGTPLEHIREGEEMYFVHSYFAKPHDDLAILCESHYGSNSFCSAIVKDNLYGFQFHPERSGEAGIEIYRQFARCIAA